MGLRSWLTQLEDRNELQWFKKSVEANPLAFGTDYLLELETEIPILGKGIWIAWSGDCTCSLTDYMPQTYVGRSVILDNLLDEFPEFHEGKGPEKFGKVECCHVDGGLSVCLEEFEQEQEDRE